MWQMRGVLCAAHAHLFSDEPVEQSQSSPVRQLCECATPPRLVVAVETVHVHMHTVRPSQHVSAGLLAAALLRICGMCMLCSGTMCAVCRWRRSAMLARRSCTRATLPNFVAAVGSMCVSVQSTVMCGAERVRATCRQIRTTCAAGVLLCVSWPLPSSRRGSRCAASCQSTAVLQRPRTFVGGPVGVPRALS